MNWIEVQYQPAENAVPGGVEYVLDVTVVNAGGMPAEVFVFRGVDDVFMQPAMVYDLNTAPPDKATAQADGAIFYRSRTAHLVYATSMQLSTARDFIKSRLARLVREWAATQVAPVGDVEVVVYSSG